MKPIYKKKVFAKGGNNKSYPVNNKFWGYENNDYTTDYKKDVDNIINNNWEAAKKYMTDNNVTYAQTPEGFRSAAFDKKVGTVHEYIKGLSNKSVPNINVVAPKKSTYTHTTDRNFYDSGQFSPEEKALYNPETLTRTITKEEFDKAMKTNYPVTNSIGAGYRENIQYAKGGNNIKPKYFAGGNAPEKGANTPLFHREKVVNLWRPGAQDGCTIRSSCRQTAVSVEILQSPSPAGWAGR